MGLLDKFRAWWEGAPDGEREGLDRRLFLKGLTVATSGLVLPRVSTFLLPPDEIEAFDGTALAQFNNFLASEGPRFVSPKALLEEVIPWRWSLDIGATWTHSEILLT